MKRVVNGACALVLVMAQAAVAQEEDIVGKIVVELNTAQTTETSCTLTFLVTNGLSTQIDRAVYETVLFDTDGQVDRLTLFDFGTLPPARPRVRQFAVPDLTCDGLGRVLINDAHACEGKGLADGTCGTALTTSSRTKIEVIG
ncbi:hypothetical protein FIU94_18895 (plasmid) [Sulfitobacter sp. THAF37]|uniref:hypothetical protein n=1 Tax=Sulfitobacter sp. THAF37 TaxID=2587855 RepID=UPI001268F0B7|nr:hypothetical protein [Sulfitobacter sp. THAF37]QFT60903.1 hypothetical protein FIU94_18895 [Sulfitobacter sp. THAF37]